MRGEKVLIFSFILLLSLSFASAGLFDWLTGKVTGDECLGYECFLPHEPSCATEGTKYFENKICDKHFGENTRECPRDCFDSYDGVCSVDAGENIYNSPIDCKKIISVTSKACSKQDKTTTLLITYSNQETFISTVEDSCMGNSVLNEYYCSGTSPDSKILSNSIACENGCSNGECLDGVSETFAIGDGKCSLELGETRYNSYSDCSVFIGTTCTDSEVGQDKFTKGELITTYIYSGFTNIATGTVDHCAGDDLIEYYCKQGQRDQFPQDWETSFYRVDCDNGCSDGACIKEKPANCLLSNAPVVCEDYNNEAACNSNECNIEVGTDISCGWYNYENTSYCGKIISTQMCGDGICSAGETASTCPTDCPTITTCGNNICDAGETASTCSIDCTDSVGTCNRNNAVISDDCSDGYITYDYVANFNWIMEVPTRTESAIGYSYNSIDGKYYYDPNGEFANCVSGTVTEVCEGVEISYCGDNICSESEVYCPNDCGWFWAHRENGVSVEYKGEEYFVKVGQGCQKNVSLQVEYSNMLDEFYVNQEDQETEKIYTLSNGIDFKINGMPCGTDVVNIKFVEKNIEIGQVSCDNGCILDNKCYPVNNRKGDKYCTIDGVFVSQQDTSSTCDNNFECSSNVCVDSTCIDASLWQKFISWLGFLN